MMQQISHRFRPSVLLIAAVLLAATASGTLAADQPTTAAKLSHIAVERVPNGGIQPQVAVGMDGTVHLIYFKGKARAGDLFYCKRPPQAAHFSKPIRINSKANSAIAAGAVRGGHLALGKNDRVHVMWNAAYPVNGQGIYYTHINDAGDGFIPQKQLMHNSYGIDGGGAIVADAKGHVMVAWHGTAKSSENERRGQVWVVISKDSGETFGADFAATRADVGACGCCGMAGTVGPRDNTYLLYRSATDGVHRDMILLRGTENSVEPPPLTLSHWNLSACPMTTASFARAKKGVFGAWENKGQVYFAHFDLEGTDFDAHTPPGATHNRKHPAIAVNEAGQVLLAWTEGAGWNKGGSLAWQVFDAQGKPLPGAGAAGERKKAGAWNFPAVYALPDGSFTVVY